MQPITYKQPRAFYSRKISVNQALKILKRNGIQVNEDQAMIILDFLYLIAKTYRNKEGNVSNIGQEPLGEIES